MKKTSWRIFLFLFVLIFLNLGLLLSMSEERIWIQEQIEKYKVGDRKGFLSRVHFDKSGQEYRYTVFIPYGLKKGDKPPVMVYLNGLGENGDDGVKPFKNGLGPAIWEMKKHFPFIVIFPQCPQGKFWNQDEETIHRTIKILDKTIAEYHADSDRVSITGISGGGIGAWEFGKRYPDRFSAILPVSAQCDIEDALKVANSNVPIWNLYVRGDKESLVNINRDIFYNLLISGHSPHFTELNGTLSNKWSTHDAWGFTYRNKAIYEWLLDQNLPNNKIARNSFQLIFNGKDLSGWKMKSGDWKVNSDSVLSCLSEHHKNSQLICFENTTPDYDLHLEFKMTNKEECNLLFHGGNDNETLQDLKLNIISPDFGSGGIIEHSTGTYLQPAESMAQRAFISDEWNDLRIKVKQGQMTVSLNGWKLHDLKQDHIQKLTGSFSLLNSSTNNSPVQWRYIRLQKHQ